MQTSKIVIGDLYAVNTPNHGTVRFKVTEIQSVTRRTQKKGSPGDTTNTIIGIIAEGDMPGTDEDRTRSVSPEAVISPYQEHAELKAKQEEADRIRKETQAHEEAVQARLQAKLYEITGLAAPATGRSYHDPFNSEYTNSIRINGHETIEKLLEVLESVEWATTSATAR
jgi:hypothetical protein